ncbi:MAG: BrnT family toxin [Syntrophaceae bacterium]|nr:BrnT family toxin [Syntrophaceae bacterium]
MKDEIELIEGFQWDDGNVDKNRVLHNVKNWECEQIFFNVPLLIIAEKKHFTVEKRWASFGHTDKGRFRALAFTKRESLIRVISAMDLSRKKRKFYEENA